MNDDRAGTAADHASAASQQSNAVPPAGLAGPELQPEPEPEPVGPVPRQALGTRALALAGFAAPALGVGEQIPVFG